ncbi:MAG: hypothetical protein WC549_00310 [Actinomycetota bacterium]
MSDRLLFICPNCDYEDDEVPLFVSVGDEVKCDGCKKTFEVVMEFREVDEK